MMKLVQQSRCTVKMEDSDMKQATADGLLPHSIDTRNSCMYIGTKNECRNKNSEMSHDTSVFSRQPFSSDSMGLDSAITSREGWCTPDAVNRKEMSVL